MTSDGSRFCIQAIVIAVLGLVAGIAVTVDAIAASSARRCAPPILMHLDGPAACPAERAAPVPALVPSSREG